MKSPRISIVTPCYNSTSFLPRLHASLCRQSFTDFEWIAVDDKSGDSTVEMLKALESPGLGGMRAYALTQNSGGGVAAGFGAEQAKGDILLIVDHDDELEDFALQTVADEWLEIGSRADIGGLFFRRLNPASGQVIGEVLQEGTEFTMSWLSNTKPGITDGVFAFRRSAAIEWFNARALEAICLFGVPLTQMTKRYKLRAGSSRPILRYHRDNPQSQTNKVIVSRKTVYTYARYIDAWDRYYLLRPGHWARHMIALGRFSLVVHGSSLYQLRYMSSFPVRVATVFLSPLSLLRNALARTPNCIDLPKFTFEPLLGLHDLRAGNDSDPDIAEETST